MQRIPSPTAETTLLPWLVIALKPMSRTKVKEWLQSGRVRVNGVSTTLHSHPVLPTDKLTIKDVPKRVVEKESFLGTMKIVYQDRAVIIVDKPSGLLSVATEGEKLDTAYARLHAERIIHGLDKPHIVHRLDRETSGLLMFATSYELKEEIQQTWESVEKHYSAIVAGAPPHPEGTITNYLRELPNLRVKVCSAESDDGKWAQTRYRTIATHGEFTQLEVELVTGRKHQIRVHLANLGCPVIGDEVYGSTHDPAKRLGLHAQRITFTHPENAQRLSFESAIPKDLRRVMTAVQGSGDRA
jgi:23S rRNA pseudouridine1911/1915/1917 synthase